MVHKDIKLPIRCIKCQEYGHTRNSCIGVEKCANCASISHPASSCTNKGARCAFHVEQARVTLAPPLNARFLPRNVPPLTTEPLKMPCPTSQLMKCGLGQQHQTTPHAQSPHCQTHSLCAPAPACKDLSKMKGTPGHFHARDVIP